MRRRKRPVRLIQTSGDGWIPGSRRCAEYGRPSETARPLLDLYDPWQAMVDVTMGDRHEQDR